MEEPQLPDSVKLYKTFDPLLSDGEKAKAQWFKEAKECFENPELVQCSTNAICNNEKWTTNDFIRCNGDNTKITRIYVTKENDTPFKLIGTLKFKNIPRSVIAVVITDQFIRSVDFSGSSQLESLKSVSLDNNGIRLANFKVLKAPELTALTMNNNKLSKLQVTDLEGLPKLKNVRLMKNPVHLSFEGVTEFKLDELVTGEYSTDEDTRTIITKDNWTEIAKRSNDRVEGWAMQNKATIGGLMLGGLALLLLFPIFRKMYRRWTVDPESEPKQKPKSEEQNH